MAGSLAPWDEISYFQSPNFTSFAITLSSAVKIASADPNRVALLIGTQAGQSAAVGTDSTVASTKGLLVSGSVPVLQLLQKDLGAIVQGEWWAIASSGNQSITVIEVLLRAWPTKEDLINAP